MNDATTGTLAFLHSGQPYDDVAAEALNVLSERPGLGVRPTPDAAGQSQSDLAARFVVSVTRPGTRSVPVRR